jgi:hypothetical protein
MKPGSYLMLLTFLITNNAFSQTAEDTTYVKNYAERMSITGYVSTNSVEIKQGNVYYKPNYPINVGLGFTVKNTVLNLNFDYGVAPLRKQTFGKTRSFDFQAHRYGQHFVLDLFFQNYRGFYQEKPEIKLYPNMSVRQIGTEGTYIFNGNKFSARAAFEQSEKQLKSAGSFVLGGGVYLDKIAFQKDIPVPDQNQIDNLQLGGSLGYAYSWAINERWLMSGIATAGVNVGNETELLQKVKIKAYPTAFARGSAGYHKSDWAAAFSFLINNKSLSGMAGNSVNLTSITMQLSYVKHFNNLFRKRKA